MATRLVHGMPLGPLVKVLVFAVVSGVVSLAIASTLIGGAGSGARTLDAEFTDASGLRRGDDVRVAGVKVGRVEGIELLDSGIARVELEVAGGTTVTDTTRATIRYQNVLGQRYVALSPGRKEGEPLPAGGTIALARTKPAIDLTLLFNGMRPLLTTMTAAEINDFGDKLIRTLQGEGGTIASLLERTASLADNFADRDELIGQVISNMNVLLETTTDHDDEIRALIDGLGTLVAGVAEQRETIMDSAAEIGRMVEATRDLVTDVRPQLRTDLDVLSTVTHDLTENTKVFVKALEASNTALLASSHVMGYGEWWNLYVCQLKVRAVVNFSYQGGPHSKRCQP